MNRKNYLSFVSFIFMIIAVLHALRILNGWEAVMGGFVIPMWFSWLGVLLAGYLSWMAFKFSKHQ